MWHRSIIHSLVLVLILGLLFYLTSSYPVLKALIYSLLRVQAYLSIIQAGFLM
ncbi:hypothetical protein KP78_28130 [Jeotgalibacillus soli]|uniref:Uncharacterized protein n=1 Tax=Jeotgalibacillus soli TaxID=889306 RepID=A0A0C2RU37_9BACL|nr:hypothetical protein KP78_28130 [Jeotgalibacillus soli]